MPIKNRFADLQNEMVTWRHNFHEYPELQFDLPRTTTKIIELLEVPVNLMYDGFPRFTAAFKALTVSTESAGDMTTISGIDRIIDKSSIQQ